MAKKRAVAISAPKSAGKRIRVGAVRIKADPEVATVGDAQILKESVKQRFIQFLSEPRNKSGAPNKAVKEKFNKPEEQSLLVEVINELSTQSRIHMSKAGSDNQLYYTLVADEVAQKYQGLDVNAKMVLQVIEKAADNGIWTKDIRMQTNIQQQALTKIFKQLEQRRLIKPVKSVTAKSKKLYMLFDLTPSKELTGGVWYSGLEFDHEFISELRTFVLHIVRKMNGGQGVTLAEIRSKMIQAKVSRVELSFGEVKQLVQTLVYDYHIEEGSINDNGEVSYVASRRITTICGFKWWDCLSPDFHFRAIKFEDGVMLGPHELHHHTA